MNTFRMPSVPQHVDALPLADARAALAALLRSGWSAGTPRTGRTGRGSTSTA